MLANEPSGWGRVIGFQYADRPVLNYLASPLPNLLHIILCLLTLACASTQLRIMCEETRSYGQGARLWVSHFGSSGVMANVTAEVILALVPNHLHGTYTQCHSGRGAVPTQLQRHPFRLCPLLVSFVNQGAFE